MKRTDTGTWDLASSFGATPKRGIPTAFWPVVHIRRREGRGCYALDIGYGVTVRRWRWTGR
jgi:hypothetical protein